MKRCLSNLLLAGYCAISALCGGIPVPKARIIPLAAPLKAQELFGQWMYPEYTAEDILEMIEGLQPQVLERCFTGVQHPEAKVPVRPGRPAMSAIKFLDASMELKSS
jgi:hypothetical protein